MPDAVILIWEWVVNAWGWIVGACGGAATTIGWLWWRNKKPSTGGDARSSELSVVRAIAGPSTQEFGLVLSDRVKFWRLKNLIHISEKFERICKEKNLDPTKLRPLTIAVGLPMLEHAANEEEDELQELWANLMVSATTDSESSADEVDYKTWTNALARMSIWDCRLLSTVVEQGVAEWSPGAISSNPLTQEEIRQSAGMSRATVDIHLENLVSMGLVYRDLATPLRSGGATGFEYAYAPTLMGMNLYVLCGNSPHWMENVASSTQEE